MNWYWLMLDIETDIRSRGVQMTRHLALADELGKSPKWMRFLTNIWCVQREESITNFTNKIQAILSDAAWFMLLSEHGKIQHGQIQRFGGRMPLEVWKWLEERHKPPLPTQATTDLDKPTTQPMPDFIRDAFKE